MIYWIQWIKQKISQENSTAPSTCSDILPPYKDLEALEAEVI